MSELDRYAKQEEATREPEFSPMSEWKSINSTGDELNDIKGYSDYVRQSYIDAGQYSDEVESDILRGAATSALKSGLIEDQSEESIRNTFYANKEVSLDERMQTIVANTPSKSDEWKKATRYLANQKVTTEEDLQNPENLARAEAIKADAEAIGGETYNAAIRRSVKAGERALAKVTNEDGTTEIITGPLLDGISKEDAIKQGLAVGNLNLSDTLEVNNLYSTPSGYKVPAHKAQRYNETSNVISALANENELLGHYVNTYAKLLGDEDKGRGTGYDSSKKESVLSSIHHIINSTEALGDGREVSQDDVNNAMNQLGASIANDSGMFELYEGDEVGKNLRSIGYATPTLHPAAAANPEIFKKTLAAHPKLSATDREAITLAKDRYLQTNFDQFNQSLSNSSLSDEWLDHLQKGRAAGANDIDTMQEFLGDGDNFSELYSSVSGVGHAWWRGLMDSGAGVAHVITDGKIGRDTLLESAKQTASRKELARLFGHEHGLGQEIAEAVGPMIIDMGITGLLSLATLPAGGVGGAAYLTAKVGARMTAKAIAKSMVSGILKAQPKKIGGKMVMESSEDVVSRLIKDGYIKGATKEIQTKGAQEAIKGFNSKLGRRIGLVPATFLPAANRSSGSTYASVYSILDQDKSLTEEEKHERAMGAGLAAGAFTGILTSAFSAIGHGGLDDALVSGMSTSQLKTALGRMSGTKGISDGVFREVIKKQLVASMKKHGGFMGSAKQIGRGAVDEGFEEGLDQLANGFIEDAFADKDTPLLERMQQTWNAAVIGGIMGGSVPAIRNTASKARIGMGDPIAGLQAQNQFVANVTKDLAESGSPMTSDVVREILTARQADKQALIEQRTKKDADASDTAIDTNLKAKADLEQAVSDEVDPDADLSDSQKNVVNYERAKPANDDAGVDVTEYSFYVEGELIPAGTPIYSLDDNQSSVYQLYKVSEDQMTGKEHVETPQQRWKQDNNRDSFNEGNSGNVTMPDGTSPTAEAQSTLDESQFDGTSAPISSIEANSWVTVDGVQYVVVSKESSEGNTKVVLQDSAGNIKEHVGTDSTPLNQTKSADFYAKLTAEETPIEQGKVAFAGDSTTVTVGETAIDKSTDDTTLDLLEIAASDALAENPYSPNAKGQMQAILVAREDRPNGADLMLYERQKIEDNKREADEILDRANTYESPMDRQQFDSQQLVEDDSFALSPEQTGEFKGHTDTRTEAEKDADAGQGDMFDATPQTEEEKAIEEEARLEYLAEQKSRLDEGFEDDMRQPELEIQQLMRGKIPVPSETPKNNYAGEYERIQQHSRKISKKKNKDGTLRQTHSYAHKVFAKKGDVIEDLDKTREALNELGFEFETPHQVLEALEASLSGEPQYPTKNRIASERTERGMNFAQPTRPTQASEVKSLKLTDSNSVFKAIANIAKTGKDAASKTVASVLAKSEALIKGIPFSVDRSTGSHSGASITSPQGTRVISVNEGGSNSRGLAGNILKQYAHAAASNASTTPTKNQTSVLTRLRGVAKLAKKGAKGNAVLTRGLASDQAFLDNLMFNPEFRESLKNVKVPKTQRNLFLRSMDHVSALMGGTTKAESAALTKVVDSEGDTVAGGVEIVTDQDIDDMANAPEPPTKAETQKAEFDGDGSPEFQAKQEQELAKEKARNDVATDEITDAAETYSVSPNTKAENKKFMDDILVYMRGILPYEVKMVISTAYPNPAWMIGNTMYVNPDMLYKDITTNDNTNPVSVANSMRLAERLVAHEMAHVGSYNALVDSDISEVASALGESGLVQVAGLYYRTEETRLAAIERLKSEDPEVRKAEENTLVQEHLRMQVERVTKGFTQEEDSLFYRGNPSVIPVMFRYFEGFLRRIAYSYKQHKGNPHIHNSVSAVLTELRAAKAGYLPSPTGMEFNPENPLEQVERLVMQKNDPVLKDVEKIMGFDEPPEQTQKTTVEPVAKIANDDAGKTEEVVEVAVPAEDKKPIRESIDSQYSIEKQGGNVKITNLKTGDSHISISTSPASAKKDLIVTEVQRRLDDGEPIHKSDWKYSALSHSNEVGPAKAKSNRDRLKVYSLVDGVYQMTIETPTDESKKDSILFAQPMGSPITPNDMQFSNYLDTFEMPIAAVDQGKGYQGPTEKIQGEGVEVTWQRIKNKMRKLFVSETDVRIQRMYEQMESTNAASVDIIKKFKKIQDKLIEDAYGEPNEEQLKDISTAIGHRAGFDIPQEIYEEINETFTSEVNAINDSDLSSEEKKIEIQKAETKRIASVEEAANEVADAIKVKKEAALEKIRKVSPELADHIIGFRENLIDPISEMLIEKYGVSPDLGVHMTANLGLYVTRSYRYFTDPKYKDLLETDKYAHLKERAAKYYEDQYIERRVKELVEGTDTKAPMSKEDAKAQAIAETKEVNVMGDSYGARMVNKTLHRLRTGDAEQSADLKSMDAEMKPLSGNLKQKKTDLPSEIRELLGEHGDEAGLDNLLRTFATVANMASTQSFLHNIIKLGRGGTDMRGKFVLTDAELKVMIKGETYDSTPEEMNEYVKYVPLRFNENAKYDPFAGYHVPIDMRDSLELMLDIQSKGGVSSAAKAMNSVIRGLQIATGTSMATKTLGSAGFYVRNIFSNMLFFGPMQGYVDMKGMAKELAYIRYAAFHMDSWDAEINEYIALDIIGNEIKSTVMKELATGKLDHTQLAEEAENEMTKAEEAENKLLKSGKWTAEGAKKLYKKAGDMASAVDAFYKIAYFKHELNVMKNARDSAEAGDRIYGMSDYELKQEAKRKVLMTAQSASQAPPLIKNITSSGAGIFAAAFLRFRAEIPRIIANTWKLSAEEIKSGNTVLRKRGIQRRAGLLTMMIGVSAIAPVIVSSVILGLSADEDEALRASMPHYLRSHSFIYMRDDEGNLRSYDLTYLNPMAMMVDPFMRSLYPLMNGDYSGAVERLGNGFIGDMFLDDPIMATAIIDSKRNVDPSTNDAIYNEHTDSLGQKALKIMSFVYGQAYKTDTQKRLEKAWQYKDSKSSDFLLTPEGVLWSALYPTKGHPIDVQKQFNSYLYDRKKAYLRSAKSMGRLNSKKPMSAGAVTDIYDERVRVLRELDSDVHKKMQAFGKLGMGDRDMFNMMTRAGYGKRHAQNIMRGVMDRPMISPKSAKKMYDADPERTAILFPHISTKPRHLVLDID